MMQFILLLSYAFAQVANLQDVPLHVFSSDDVIPLFSVSKTIQTELSHHRILAKDYALFRNHAASGNNSAMISIYNSVSSDRKHAMLAARNQEAFVNATKNSHLDTIQQIYQWANSTERITMIDSIGNIFELDLDILSQIFNWMNNKEQLKAIETYSRTFLGFIQKCIHQKRLDTFKLIFETLPVEIRRRLLESGRCHLFVVAVWNNNLEFIEYFLSFENADQLIRSRSYQSFLLAILNEDETVLRKLLNVITQGDKEAMIQYIAEKAFYAAATEGKVFALHRVRRLASSTLFRHLNRMSNYMAFRRALEGGHNDCVNQLLSWLETRDRCKLMRYVPFNVVDKYKLYIGCSFSDRMGMRLREYSQVSYYYYMP